MRRIVDYKLVDAWDGSVKAALADGWELWCGPVDGQFGRSQAMVRWEEKGAQSSLVNRPCFCCGISCIYSCSECRRAICDDCMTYASDGRGVCRGCNSV